MKIRIPTWITIASDADGYMVICKCGWISPSHPATDRAIAMLEQHLDVIHDPDGR